MGLFGKDKPPKEQLREWTSKLRRETYRLDRQIKIIQNEENKIKKSLKSAAKDGDKDVCILLAKEIVRSRKAISRIHASKAQINSVLLGINHQLAMLRTAGTLQRSTEVMKSMQALVKVPDIARTMQELSKEMMKAGIIEEMMEDSMDEVLDSEELEEAASEEIDKILFEVTAGALGEAPAAVRGGLDEPTTSNKEEEDIEAMRERLEALRS